MANRGRAVPGGAEQILHRDALYYPYIHIRSVDWLKRALLIFPHVARIMPRDYFPRDERDVLEFERTSGRWGAPLLRQADLTSRGVREAQLTLLKLLSNDCQNDPSFLARYGSRSRFDNRSPNEFYLHTNKPLYELTVFLRENDLMWLAERATNSGDTVVHPIVGEIIMSTIAMACAQDEGFDVVTDDGQVHRDIREAAPEIWTGR
jgi:hypothetical protein